MRRYALLFGLWLFVYSGLGFSQAPLFSYHVKTMIASENDFAVDHDLLTQFWQMLQEDHVLEVRFEHKERRNTAIFLQDIVERTLTQNAKKYSYLTGLILTSKPSSALSIGNPQAKLREWGLTDRVLSVVTRHRDLKAMLAAGVSLYSVYPQKGLAARDSKDRAYYQQLVKMYPNLMDVKLPVKRLPGEFSGAMYLFKDVDAKTYAFMIHASQADLRADEQIWHLWFGDVNQPDVKRRLERVFTYVQKNNKNARLSQEIKRVLALTAEQGKPNDI